MKAPKTFSGRYTFVFIVLLCTICATILALLALFLKKPQEKARNLYRYKQLLISAQLLPQDASEVISVYENNIEPMLTNDKGNLISFAQAGLSYEEYLSDHEIEGYAKLPLKLVYVIKGPKGYIIPINGYGLWGPIYGYLSLEKDAITVRGITWYEQMETPGLGGEISTPSWQEQFVGKKIAIGDLLHTQLGIDIVKPGRKNLKSNEVDGITGASFTSDAVMHALKKSLSEYRNFIIKMHETANEM